MKDKIIDPFINVEDKPLVPAENYGDDFIVQAKVFQAGFGNKAMRVDQSGMWLGGARYADAPFRVDMQGRVYIQSSDGAIVIDSVNKRILIHDGTNNRVLIGYQLNGF